MTDKMRSADVHAEIFVTPATNGSFAKEQTLAKIGATTKMRDFSDLRVNTINRYFQSFADSERPAIMPWRGFSNLPLAILFQAGQFAGRDC